MLEKGNYTKRIFKGGSIIIFFAILSSPLGYLIRILYSRTLSIEMFGLIYAVMAFFDIFITYNDLGFGYSVAFLVPKFIKRKRFSKAWNTYVYDTIIEIGTSIFISLILIIFSKYLTLHYFKVPQAQNLIYIFLIYFVTNSFLQALNKFFVGLQQEIYYSSFQFTKNLFALLFSFLFLFFDKGNVLTYALAFSLARVAAVFIYTYFFYNKNRLLVRKFAWDKELFSKMYSYAIPTLLTTSVYTFISSTDVFFLTLFKGVTYVGIYNIVLPIVSVSSIFLSPINQLLFPAVSHLMEGEREKVEILIGHILKIIPFVGAYFALFTILFPSTITGLLFGSKWVGKVETPIIILSIGIIISSLSSFLTTFLGGTGRVKERLHASILIALLNLAISIFLIKKFGVVGATISNSLVFLFSVFIYGKILNRDLKFKYPLKFYIKMVIFSLVVFSLVKIFGIKPIGWVEFIAYGICYTIIYSIFGFYLKIIGKDVIRLFIKI